MSNSLTWRDLPEAVSQWPGLPLSLSGDEVMPLDYHAGRSGWLLYGRSLDKQRLTAYPPPAPKSQSAASSRRRGRPFGFRMRH